MTDLSPAAQAVYDAFWDDIRYNDDITNSNIAAALRAAADQVVPNEPEPRWWEPVRLRFNRQCIRRRFLAVADELEKQAYEL